MVLFIDSKLSKVLGPLEKVVESSVPHRLNCLRKYNVRAEKKYCVNKTLHHWLAVLQDQDIQRFFLFY